ncbi:MAG: hypothetical protein J0I23_04820 [Rhizobiales bacterium]|nr:hypothetical protein [Hyphomicrobiales bacterium]
MMQVINIRRSGRPREAVIFDIQIGDHLRLYNLSLRECGNGYRVIAPNAFGKHSATFTPTLAEQITRAAVAAIGGRRADAATGTQ